MDSVNGEGNENFNNTEFKAEIFNSETPLLSLVSNETKTHKTINIESSLHDFTTENSSLLVKRFTECSQNDGPVIVGDTNENDGVIETDDVSSMDGLHVVDHCVIWNGGSINTDDNIDSEKNGFVNFIGNDTSIESDAVVIEHDMVDTDDVVIGYDGLNAADDDVYCETDGLVDVNNDVNANGSLVEVDVNIDTDDSVFDSDVNVNNAKDSLVHVNDGIFDGDVDFDKNDDQTINKGFDQPECFTVKNDTYIDYTETVVIHTSPSKIPPVYQSNGVDQPPLALTETTLKTPLRISDEALTRCLDGVNDVALPNNQEQNVAGIDLTISTHKKSDNESSVPCMVNTCFGLRKPKYYRIHFIYMRIPKRVYCDKTTAYNKNYTNCLRINGVPLAKTKTSAGSSKKTKENTRKTMQLKVSSIKNSSKVRFLTLFVLILMK